MVLKSLTVNELSYIFFGYPSPLKFKFHLGNWLSRRLSLHLCQTLKIGISKGLKEAENISIRKIICIGESTDEFQWTFTSSAVGLSFGSNANIFSNKRRASGSAFGNLWEKGICFFFRILLKYLRAFSLRTCLIKLKIRLGQWTH